MSAALVLPDPALLLLIGISGSGKSTFAARHFRETEILSSDRLRAWICDDEGDQSVTSDAFTLLHMIVDRRLAHRRACLIDATNTQGFARRGYLSLARRHQVPAVALILDVPVEVCVARAAGRSRIVAPEVIQMQSDQLRATLPLLSQEGFAAIHLLRPRQLEELEITRDRRRAYPRPAP